MRRIASTAKLATSRIPIRISPGFPPKGVVDRTIQICEWDVRRLRSIGYPRRNTTELFEDVTESAPASRCCPYRGFQRRWTCPIGAVIAGRAQTVHSDQRGRAKGVRPPDGVDEP